MTKPAGKRFDPLLRFLDHGFLDASPAQEPRHKLTVVLERRDQVAHNLGLAPCAQPANI